MPASWRARMSRTREKAEKRGHFAELVALTYLRLKGYRLLAQRFKSPQGEVDLIMRRRDVTAFIEVKARAQPRSRRRSRHHHPVQTHFGCGAFLDGAGQNIQPKFLPF